MSSPARIRRVVNTLLAIVAILIVLRPASASEPNNPYTAKEYLEPIKFLASDQLKGRGAGTPELNKAADYIASHFKKYGLKPGGDNGTFYQKFTLVVGAELGPKNLFTWQQGGQTEKLKVSQDFIPLSFSANTSVEAPLVFAGYGITAPEYNYDDYQHLDVTGKIVIVMRHEPQEDDEKSVFAGKQMTAHAQVTNKAINAKNHGAVGMILVNDVGNHSGDADTLLKIDEVSGPQEMSIPIVQVKADIANAWLKATGHTLDDLCKNIDKDVSAHSMPLDAGLKVAMQVEIDRIRKQVSNVIALLPGTDPALKEQYIVVGAHYDHLGLGEHDSLSPKEKGKPHHGADDNASGTAAVLEIADVFAHAQKKPRHSIVFICFAGEELGLLGSAYYTGHPTCPI